MVWQEIVQLIPRKTSFCGLQTATDGSRCGTCPLGRTSVLVPTSPLDRVSTFSVTCQAQPVAHRIKVTCKTCKSVFIYRVTSCLSLTNLQNLRSLSSATERFRFVELAPWLAATARRRSIFSKSSRPSRSDRRRHWISRYYSFSSW